MPGDWEVDDIDEDEEGLVVISGDAQRVVNKATRVFYDAHVDDLRDIYDRMNHPVSNDVGPQCDMCDSTDVVEIHCEIVCKDCGAKRDCSDF
mgnify:CR=1 FL=1